MKTLSVLLVVVMLTGSVSAKIWTMDNRPGANFVTLASAHNAASSGDTILIAGSSATYSGFTCTKQLTIIGPGFFLDGNTGLQANVYDATITGNIDFTTGSNNSVLMGVHVIGQVIIRTPIRIERCYLENAGSAVYLTTGASSTVITRNYIYGNHSGYSAAPLNIAASLSDVIISHNFIEHAGSSYSALNTNSYTLSGSSAIYNNVIRRDVSVNGSSFYNNILREGDFTSVGVTPYNNIANSTQFGAGNGNQQNVNMDDVFVGTGSPDGKWQIKAGGPADGAGFGGADCGMFDNSLNTAYILSGIPPIPAIYEFTANADLSSITVKARANQ